MRLFTTVAVFVATFGLGGTAHAQPAPASDERPFFALGFATLHDAKPGQMGDALSFEHPAEDGSGDTWQWTTNGLAYVHAGIPSHTDGWHHMAMVGRELVEWDGTEITPPPPTYAIASIPTPTGPWSALAECESGGNWSAISSNGRYYGGLQEDMVFWTTYGGLTFAPRPDLASRAAQITVAQRGQLAQGWGAWPLCSRRIGLR